MMTITEVIETLKANYPDACFEQLREAVDAAIVVLKAQDTAGDTVVSRQAVKDWLLRWEGYIDKDTIIRMQARVIDIPSAGVEPVKRGTWTWKHDRYKCVMGPVSWYECSNCEGIAYVEHPYCPHCGAKMEKPEEHRK